MPNYSPVIHFGTDGWRAVIADEYTFENVRRVAAATAFFWRSEKRKSLECYRYREGTYPSPYRPAESGIVVGYDARFLSDQFAREAATMIASHGIPVFLSKTIVPTPILSYAIQDRKLSGGVMITASHNPYQWNGFKIKMEFAGSSLPEATRAIEEILEKSGQDKVPFASSQQNPIREVELFEPYFEFLRKGIDFDLIQKSGFSMLVDPMFGTNVGVMRRLMPKASIEEIHGERNPIFGGLNPEPIDVNLQELMRLVPARKASVGLAFDGDGDRIGAVDEQGNFLSSHEILCLLLWHLVKHRKWSGGVVKTFSVTNRLKRLAEYFHLPFYELPIGFKNVAKLFLTKDILIGGEESGGIGTKNHIPERDSLWNALLLLELMSKSGKKLGEVLQEVHAVVGASVVDRIDLHLRDGEKEAVFAKLRKETPAQIANLSIQGIDPLDGIKCLLSHDSWILFRASGTEPLLRIYAEAENRAKVRELLDSGRELVKSCSAAARS